MKRVELIAPGGSLHKLKTAVLYGADAVYCGLSDLNLRVRAENFSKDEMAEGIDFAHKHGAKVFLTLNSFLFEDDLVLFEKLAKETVSLSPDAVIISDPSAVVWFRENAPQIKLHLSTQAGCMNSRSAKFWKSQGISRVVLSREVTLEQLKSLLKNSETEVEIFTHGAMCAAVSGRCMLSSYLAKREADQGDCQQPCRWIYSIKDIKGEGAEFDIIENETGTTILSAKDLCLFDYLPEIIDAGVSGLKIEGRIKTDFYVACVVRAYRKALDEYYANPEQYKSPERWKDELYKISHREYSTGFLFGKEKISQTYLTESFIRNTIYKGSVMPNIIGGRNCLSYIIVKERILPGEEMEAITPDKDFTVTIQKMYNDDMEEIFSGEPGQKIFAKTEPMLEPYSYLRKQCSAPFMRI